MFDSYDFERLAEWKKFRNTIEIDKNPFDLVSEFWARAPLVNTFLDPTDCTSWPDPWHLVLDNKYDDLAICLGMLYTLKLTERFMESSYEIHKITPNSSNSFFILIIDKKSVLNYEFKKVTDFSAIKNVSTSVIYRNDTKK